MSGHTQGPLRLDGKWGGVLTPGGERLLVDGVALPMGNNPGGKANARRLVALWNACRGIPTEALEEVAGLDDCERLLRLRSVARNVREAAFFGRGDAAS